MVVDAMIATALRSSSGENSTGSTDSASGNTAAAPMPKTARATISSPTLAAYAQAAELSRKTVSAMSRSRLRPYRSPSSPAGRIAAAITRL